MKKIVLLLMVLATTCILIGCSGGKANTTAIPAENPSQTDLAALLKAANIEKAEISIYYDAVVPDTARATMASWITETVRAASSHMTAGDYEDPEDLIDEVADQAKKIFAINTAIKKLIYTYKGEGNDWNYVRYEDLTPAQKKVFDFLNQ